uniref:Uncharacterized protein n=1 Tax=Oryza brachyantha TaxID=4533 RepID=J3L1Y5_ORYBR
CTIAHGRIWCTVNQVVLKLHLKLLHPSWTRSKSANGLDSFASNGILSWIVLVGLKWPRILFWIGVDWASHSDGLDCIRCGQTKGVNPWIESMD